MLSAVAYSTRTDPTGTVHVVSMKDLEAAHPSHGLQEKIKEAGTGSNQWEDEEIKNIVDQMPERRAPMEGTRARTTSGASDSSEKKGNRSLRLDTTPKKKIMPAVELLGQEEALDNVRPQHLLSHSSSEGDIMLSVDDLKTPDDLTTPEAMGDSVFDGELDWESDTSGGETVEPIPEYTAREEFEDERNWRTVNIGEKNFRIDMKVIEPYKKVLSHGGYYGDGFNAIIVFAGCYLPDKRRRDYTYVMDNLFLYVVSTLELLVVEDYMIVYFHGATPKHKMPGLRWLKRCYEMIDRRLRKNLKSLLLVHPTLWLRTIVLMTRPFISSKFSSKLRYVRTLQDLANIVPTEYIFIPDEVKVYDAQNT